MDDGVLPDSTVVFRDENSASAVAVIACIFPFCCCVVGFGVGGVITLFIIDFIKLLGSSFKFKFNERRCDSKPFIISLFVNSSVMILFFVFVAPETLLFCMRKTLCPSKQCINSCAASQLAHNQFTQSAHFATAIDCFPLQPVHRGKFKFSFSAPEFKILSPNLPLIFSVCGTVTTLDVTVVGGVVVVLFLIFCDSTLLLLVKTKSSHIAESLIGGDDPLPLAVDGESDK